jgi:hypothetical protein
MTDLIDALLTAAVTILAGFAWGVAMHLWA